MGILFRTTSLHLLGLVKIPKVSVICNLEVASYLYINSTLKDESNKCIGERQQYLFSTEVLL